MDFNKTRIPGLMIGMIVIILACNVPGSTVESLPADSTAAPESVTPTETPIPHVTIPSSLPAERSSHAGDYDSSTTATSRQSAGGDRFTFGRFERPFNADSMDIYFSEIDIIDTLVFQDDTWIYGVITLQELKPAGGMYALELDLDLDGKGDWLIVAASPAGTDWTTDAVQVLHDANKDVGNQSAMYTDKNVTGDGFEQLAFDSGLGADPDSAWVRISPGTPNTLEIAVKRSVLGNPEKYLINMWAGNSLLDPGLFDLNDHFSHEQAGAADPGFEIFYPIKAVSEIDNSCRMAVGFEPTGQEPGLCEVLIPDEPPAGCQLTPASCSPAEYFNAPACRCDVIIIF
jgi:hypothetical protein